MALSQHIRLFDPWFNHSSWLRALTYSISNDSYINFNYNLVEWHH